MSTSMRREEDASRRLVSAGASTKGSLRNDSPFTRSHSGEMRGKAFFYVLP